MNVRRGFSLAELLVAVAVAAALASLLLAAIARSGAASDRAAGLSGLRQIGLGIQGYAADHGGLLPGKLWPGQVPVIDRARPGRLAVFLAPYLGEAETPDGGLADLFAPPAYRRESIAMADARTYVMNMAMPSPDGGTINVWGSEADPASPGPRAAASIPARSWFLSDADQLHPRVAAAPWKRFTPARPIHGEKRQALYSDGSASAAGEEELR